MNVKSIKKPVKTKTDKTKLHQQNDKDIDYSDISATSAEFWQDAKVLMPEHKIPLSLRLDEDVVQYFKGQGRGYQTRINAVLKAYVHAHAK